MKKLSALALFLLATVVMLNGCRTTGGGDFSQRNETSVSLSNNNYKIVKASAKGVSRGFYLFGFIPITIPSYADAKSDLYKDSGVPIEGRSIALTNQAQDKSSIYLILFSLPTITVTADIIEFNSASSEPAGK